MRNSVSIGCLIGMLGIVSGQEGPLPGYGPPDGAGSEDPGVLALAEAIPGNPGVDYPIYAIPPETSFSCDGYIEGYYADPEADCQMFHICANDGNGGSLSYPFLCPNGTLFNQQYFICDWWFNTDCSQAEDLYYLNEEVAAAAAAATAASGNNVGIDSGLNARRGNSLRQGFGNDVSVSNSALQGRATGLQGRKERIGLFTERLPLVLNEGRGGGGNSGIPGEIPLQGWRSAASSGHKSQQQIFGGAKQQQRTGATGLRNQGNKINNRKNQRFRNVGK